MPTNVNADIVELLSNDVRTSATDGNHTGVDMQDYDFGEMKITLASDEMGSTDTLDVHIEESDDDSTYADISGASFTQVAQSASTQTILVNRQKRYIRVVSLVSSTTGGAYTVLCAAQKQYRS
jgi:hypothetical protein